MPLKQTAVKYAYQRGEQFTQELDHRSALNHVSDGGKRGCGRINNSQRRTSKREKFPAIKVVPHRNRRNVNTNGVKKSRKSLSLRELNVREMFRVEVGCTFWRFRPVVLSVR